MTGYSGPVTTPAQPSAQPPPGPASLIVSPYASRVRDAHRRAGLVRQVVRTLASRGHGEVVVVEAGEPATVRQAAADAVARRSSLVVLAGGDGTVRDAAGALADTGVTVGIIPCGTGNLYAASIGVPRDLRKAVANLTTGTAQPFDLGQVRIAADGRTEEGVFTVTCGTGLDARLIAATTREMKRRYGVAAYFLSGAGLINQLQAQPTTLAVDDEQVATDAVVVLVANCGEPIPGRLGPRLPIDPQDGQLHVFVLPRSGVVGGIRGVLELMTAATPGISSSGAAIRMTGRRVKVSVSPAQPTQVDGDVYPVGSIEAWIRPGALSVLVP
jgi:diacylglycerol kinase family enzyme